MGVVRACVGLRSIAGDVSGSQASVSRRRPQREHVATMLGSDMADSGGDVARGLHQLLSGAVQEIVGPRGGAGRGGAPRLRQLGTGKWPRDYT